MMFLLNLKIKKQELSLFKAPCQRNFLLWSGLDGELWMLSSLVCNLIGKKSSEQI